MGDTAAVVDGVPMICTLDGVLRGILPDGTPVHKGLKSGDITEGQAVRILTTSIGVTREEALAIIRGEE